MKLEKTADLIGQLQKSQYERLSQPVQHLSQVVGPTSEETQLGESNSRTMSRGDTHIGESSRRTMSRGDIRLGESSSRPKSKGDTTR